MTWPDHLVERALRRPDLDLGVIAGSTPVVAFGDPVESWVATVGINPSQAEFLDESGDLLDGPDRRLATLRSLGVERYEDLTRDHAVAIVGDCAAYFDRRPYQWFRPLDEILTHALGAGYAARTACHLDLVQWATRQVWGELAAEDQDELQRQDVGFLRTQLTTLGHRLILVNGKSAMASVERNRIVRWQRVATLDRPPTTTFSVGEADDKRYHGWSCNLQSQHGAARHVEQIAELVALHATGRRRPLRAARSGLPSSDTAGDGPVPKGLRFASRSELASYLAGWLQRSSSDRLGIVGDYGGKAWITVDSEAGAIRINSDTKREATEAFVAASRTPRSYDWLVVASVRSGKINKVLFSEDRTEGWYAYVTEELEREARLGGGRDVSVTLPPAEVPPVPIASPARTDGRADPLVLPGMRPPPASPSGTRAVGLGAAIVQFPHPGGEHVPPGSRMGWNTGPHQRKFLVSPGRYVDASGQVHDDRLVFWGEWEAQSRIVHRWPSHTDLPTVLHEPYWSPPPGRGERQNTDPWVFGDRFRYSNCKQHTSNLPDRRPSALQRLPRGSVILFGSGGRDRFVLDTVLLVGGIDGTFVPAAGRGDLPIDEAFDVCTLRSLAGYAPHIAGSDYTLFRGATIDDPVDGMFSFAPCLAHGDPHMRFARPAIDLPGIVNPASTQSPSGAKQMRPLGEVVDTWRRVVDQVRDAGLELGVHFATPPRQDGT